MTGDEFRKLYPDVDDQLTPEEEVLLLRLAKPWPCMHPLDKVMDIGSHWHCTVCGIYANKIFKTIAIGALE